MNLNRELSELTFATAEQMYEGQPVTYAQKQVAAIVSNTAMVLRVGSSNAKEQWTNDLVEGLGVEGMENVIARALTLNARSGVEV